MLMRYFKSICYLLFVFHRSHISRELQLHCMFCRFLDSEVELNDTVQEMHIIATVPELYHIVVELSTVQSLLQLLSHDNTGIWIATPKCSFFVL